MRERESESKPVVRIGASAFLLAATLTACSNNSSANAVGVDSIDKTSTKSQNENSDSSKGDIRIEGDRKCITEVAAALLILRNKAPDHYKNVNKYIEPISYLQTP